MAEKQWFQGWYEDTEPGVRVEAPFSMILGATGKTMVCIYPRWADQERQELIAEKFIDLLGEPEFMGRTDENPQNINLLFPHQNLPPELMDLAERMTTTLQLRCLANGVAWRES
jgi:hypothetical protein